MLTAHKGRKTACGDNSREEVSSPCHANRRVTGQDRNVATILHAEHLVNVHIVIEVIGEKVGRGISEGPRSMAGARSRDRC